MARAAKRPEVEVRKVVGGRVRALREERGLSQDEVARTAGIDRSHLSGIETGTGPRNVGVETLNGLARALGVRLTDLLAGV